MAHFMSVNALQCGLLQMYLDLELSNMAWHDQYIAHCHLAWCKAYLPPQLLSPTQTLKLTVGGPIPTMHTVLRAGDYF